jgi:predicted transglutaminase-like cysteine proteinase
VVLTTKAWKDLERVNLWVNTHIQPMTDLEHWGVVERWNYPDDGYGDCEDYVLLKRRMLIQSGWPREALLVTVVRDNEDEGHAVLTVITDKGDYVLDNKNEFIVLWSDTGYRFVKRQSQSDPNVWVSLGDPRPAITTATERIGILRSGARD